MFCVCVCIKYMLSPTLFLSINNIFLHNCLTSSKFDRKIKVSKTFCHVLVQCCLFWKNIQLERHCCHTPLSETIRFSYFIKHQRIHMVKVTQRERRKSWKQVFISCGTLWTNYLNIVISLDHGLMAEYLHPFKRSCQTHN